MNCVPDDFLRLKTMKSIPKFILLLSFTFVCVSAVFAQSTPQPPPKPRPPAMVVVGVPVETWPEFQHEGGNFAVKMPAKPLEMKQTIESEIGKIPIYSFIAQEDTLNFMAMYAEYPMSLDTPAVAKASLNNSRDLMMSRRNSELISETDISFGKYPGREIKAKFDGGIMRSRTYIVNQRMYMLMVMAVGGAGSKQLESKTVNDFLVSFKLLREPKPVESGAPSMSRVDSEIENLDLPADFASRPISWREVPSPEFGFTVWMPSEPFRKRVPLNPNDKRLDINLWMSRGENSIFQMMVQPMLAAPNSDEHRKVFFRTLIDGILNSSKMKLESEKPIGFEGHPGREFKLLGSYGVGIGRAYIIGSNVYVLMVLPFKKAAPARDESSENARFYDSFRLTKDPDAAPAVGSVSSGATTWREFTEPNHGFKVMLPDEPSQESSSLQDVLTYNLIAAGDGIVCVITRQELSAPLETQSEKERYYRSFIKSLKDTGGIEVSGETDVIIDGRKVREYKMKKFDKTGVARVFLIGNDAYSVSAMDVLPGATAKAVSTFMESFKLIEKSPPTFISPSRPPSNTSQKPDGRLGSVEVSAGTIMNSVIKKVEPDYPPIARAAGAGGKVIVNITISDKGKVIEAEIVEGHPLLRDSVLQAVKQWEFKPAELSGVKAGVQAVLTFDFALR